MKSPFKIGDTHEYRRVVEPADIASFNGQMVHPVCGTFALARDIEWTSRQFVIEMCDDDEEGVGTMLTIQHTSPAFVGEEIVFTASIDQINGNELICSYEARVGDRLIAEGKTGQKVLTRDRIAKKFTR